MGQFFVVFNYKKPIDREFRGGDMKISEIEKMRFSNPDSSRSIKSIFFVSY